MLDINICICVIKNKTKQVLCKIKEAYASGFCISAITLAELEYGAAHAKAAGLTIVTNDVKEFARVQGLKIENWANRIGIKSLHR